jgi:hypothetical protein
MFFRINHLFIKGCGTTLIHNQPHRIKNNSQNSKLKKAAITDDRLSEIGIDTNLVGGFFRSHIDAATIAVKKHTTIHKGENRVVTPHANTAAGMPLGTTLTDNDVAGDNGLTTELLHAEALAAGVTTVPYRTLTFLMCHNLK